MSFLTNVKAQTTAIVDANSTTCGLNNGTAQVYPTGGAGYTYKWSNSAVIIDTITNLASGNYTVTVYGTPISDSVVKAFSIGASTQPTLSITATRDTICLSSSDELVAHGATPGGYTWSGGTLAAPVNADSINVSSLNAGNYTYNLSWGAPACPASTTYTMTDILVAATLGTIVQPSCGRNSGSITCNVSSSPNSVNTFLQNGIILQQGSGTQILNLGAGNYTFAVSDITTGCTDTIKNIILTDTSSIPLFTNIVVNPELCFGNKKGAIYVTVSNCTSGCTYSWSQNAADHTDSAVSLPAGIDTFYVSKGGCTNIDTIINVPGPRAALKDSLHAHPDHCGHHIGSALMQTTGGTVPYSYIWSQGTAMGDSVSQLVGDSIVSVIVTDNNGCVDSAKAFITSTRGPRATLNRPDTICATDATGVLIVTPTTNDGPFTYLWSNGQTTNVDAGLTPGGYTVKVTDAVGCDTILNGFVPRYQGTLTTSILPLSILHAGQSAEIILNTDVPVRTVVWSPYIPGSTGSTLVSVSPSQTTVYTVIITYGQTCQLFDTITVDVVNDTATLFTIPNTFTPNGDGVNDNFKLITYPALGSFHIWVFDRWGNKVYESTDADFEWNGLNEYAGGAVLNTGVFSYVVEYEPYNSSGKKTIGGNISLIK